MSKADEKTEKQFLRDLAKLTKRYGKAIGGCGCCGSPYVYDVPVGKDGQYTLEEKLEWIEKGEKS